VLAVAVTMITQNIRVTPNSFINSIFSVAINMMIPTKMVVFGNTCGTDKNLFF
jgi:hypothetical protein